MQAPLRKFVVGLIALAALLGVYWFYARANRTPPIAADVPKVLPVPVADVNAGPPGGVGTILGVDIGQVQQTRFMHRNENNQVDRIFGFEQLLHRQSKQWEITNPYMKLFFPTFRCEVTANQGKVQVEAIFSQLMAEDAQFSGNVVIHIVPTEPNDALECFIHLDDVGFLAAKSLFSSKGAVRFLSRRAQLTGTGMELIYDEGRSRLELFRIFQLDNLRLSSREMDSMADLTSRQRPQAAPPAPGASVSKAVGTGADTSARDRYQCIFHGNVVIAAPRRVVTARDELVIDHIVWPKPEEPNAPVQRAADRDDPNAAPHPGPDALVTTASSHSAISAIPPEAFDTVVTCDGGFEVTPMDTKLKMEVRRQKAANSAALSPPSSVFQNPSSGAPDRQRVTARRIHFDAFTTDTTLEGPIEMAFLLDPNGFREAKSAAQAMPMTVAAQKVVRFLAAVNQILFEGDCRVALLRSEPNLTYEYLLTAPQLTLDIATDPNRPKGGNVTARQIVTEGGPAALRILRKSGDKLVGWTTLDAAQLQYEAGPRQFTALGPGELWIRNDEFINPQADPNQFSLGRPCIARLANFDKLTYSGVTNRIVAEDDSQQLLLDYFPLTNGKYDRHTRAIAGHVEALLNEVTKGHLELASLTATQGIEYEYEDPTSGQSFVGSSLSYDYTQSLVAVRGDAEQPCYLNGALVDQIDLDLKTGRAKAEILAPSTFRVQR